MATAERSRTTDWCRGCLEGVGPMTDESTIVRMHEFSELHRNVRQLRENAMELEDAVTDVKWVIAGGRSTYDPDQWDQLVEASRGICEILEEKETPKPREVRDDND